MNNCKICNNSENNKYYNAKEMQFGGDNEIFNYMECNLCGCLQLINIPEDFSKYYPEDYYSFNSIEISNDQNIIQRFNNYLITNYYYSKISIISKLVFLIYPEIKPPIKNNKYLYDKRILDVGCGSGKLLKILSKAGFNNLVGIDPFIKDDIEYNTKKNKIIIYKKEIFDLNNELFDIIMLNSSFEHMIEQEKVLLKIYSLLNNNMGGGGGYYQNSN